MKNGRLATIEADIKYIKKALNILAVLIVGHLGLTAVPVVVARLVPGGGVNSHSCSPRLLREPLSDQTQRRRHYR